MSYWNLVDGSLIALVPSQASAPLQFADTASNCPSTAPDCIPNVGLIVDVPKSAVLMQLALAFTACVQVLVTKARA